MNTSTYRPSDDSSLQGMGWEIIKQIMSAGPARITREEIRRNSENSRHQPQLEQQRSSLATSPQTQKVEGK